jgi:uncharacterized membrane protein (UPF0127 family)
MTPDAKSIVNLTRGTVVCERVVIADQALHRMRGLLGRRWLPVGEGLLLQPAPSVHTAFMRFPIDVIFLDRNHRVVKVVENLRRWRTASARHARAALELPAGEAAARGIEIGDTLGTVAGSTGAYAIEGGAPARNGRASGNGRNGGRDEPLVATGDAADCMRVFLVGNDRRFRSVTSALLTRRGCTVTLDERMDCATVRASRERPEVVVIDVDTSPAAVAQEAGEFLMLEPPVGVVLVGDKRSVSATTMPVLAKWGPFDELYGAIMTARPDRDRRRPNGGR